MRKYFFIVFVFMFACRPSLPEEVEVAYAQLPKHLDYNIHVKPILSDKCFACHGNDKNKIKAGLRLDNAKDAYAVLKENDGMYAVVPHKLRKSEMYHRVTSEDPDMQMPPPESNLKLNPKEIAILTKWIEQGAEYKDHWAFLAPERAKIKKLRNKDWSRNEIDYFVLDKLESNGWKPSEEADKLTLLRRVTLDITGLPPTLQDIQDFENDSTAEAFETVVDGLLASSAYGERMSVEWMDLARFADTHGYTVDRYRDMSPWRDWVIKAFNDNLPYDEFVTWQLAGDLLPNPTRDQVIATAFNRNHQQNMEGGIIDEEYRVEYVADRANTFGTAFLGLTVECARCHDHKYDPISQKEYFELFSFFNNVNEAGQISFNNATPVPTLLLTDEKIDSIADFVDKEVEAKLDGRELEGFERWLQSSPKIDLEYNKPIAMLDFNGSIGNSTMKQMHAKDVEANFEEGSIRLNGDAWVDLNGVGAFNKDQEFSVKIRIKFPAELKDGVVFHKGQGAALYNFRGFHLALKDSKLEAIIAHTKPENAIIKLGSEDVPKEEWIDLAMTYDGSSKATGLKVYLNGERLNMATIVDNLYKDILFNVEEEPGVQIGARYRGVGLKGALVDEFRLYDKEISQLEISENSERSEELLKDYYRLNIDPDSDAFVKELYDIRRLKTETLDTVAELMVMKEMLVPRQAHILERGSYDNYGAEVFPSTINAVLPFSADLPRNRLGLSIWLFDEQNPLTARVAVNRIWQQLFGRGLVNSASDFGNQGEMPSHLELLDHLALEFIESGWDQKALIKAIVMSSTYRQSSVLREEMMALDAENIYYWRGPSSRLSAEMMRDNALMASGLLVDKIGGPSVKPYQPKGLWAINGGEYVRDSTENLYRRSLYTFWKRSVPNPTQAIFDAPDRSSCSITRQKTNTPLQALVLMNDPAFVESSKVLAAFIAKTENVELAISQAFMKLTGRNPSDEELGILISLRQEEYEKFLTDPAKMEGWLNTGDYEVTTSVSEAELAANTVIASAIINADASIIKR